MGDKDKSKTKGKDPPKTQPYDISKQPWYVDPDLWNQMTGAQKEAHRKKHGLGP